MSEPTGWSRASGPLTFRLTATAVKTSFSGGGRRLTALLRSTAVRAGRKGNDWDPCRLGGSVSDRWIVRELAGSTGGVGRLQWPLVLALQPRASTRLWVRRRSHVSVAGSQ